MHASHMCCSVLGNYNNVRARAPQAEVSAFHLSAAHNQAEALKLHVYYSLVSQNAHHLSASWYSLSAGSSSDSSMRLSW